MGRSFLFAIAATLCLLGFEAMLVKRATLTLREPAQPAASSYDYSFLDPTITSAPADGAKRVIEPPEWAPFVLLSSGIVLLLHLKSLGKGG